MTLRDIVEFALAEKLKQDSLKRGDNFRLQSNDANDDSNSEILAQIFSHRKSAAQLVAMLFDTDDTGTVLQKIFDKLT